MKNLTDVQSNISEKVLLYAREPTGYGNLFREYGDLIIRDYLKTEEYKILSDYPSKADYYLDLKKYKVDDYTAEDYLFFENNLDINQIIKNERVFRINMSYLDSCNLIFACAKFLLDFFRENSFDVLVTNMPDCYIVDILTQIARQRGIRVVSCCGSSFGRDHIRITERGELNKVREVDDSEVTEFLGKMSEKYDQPYVSSKKQVYLKVLKYYFSYKAKYVLHYLINYKLLNKLNYRFLMTVVDTYPRRLIDIFGVNKFFTKDVSSLRRNKLEKFVYIPLHYHPEATTEYWVPKKNYLTYYFSLYKTIQHYVNNGYTVLVKEHTASYLRRDRNIYKKILSFKNTFLVSPFVSTYEMFELADYVVVWTGTTGVEAIMANKKVVLAESDVYFSLGKLPYVGEEDKCELFSDSDKEKLARNILEGLFPLTKV